MGIKIYTRKGDDGSTSLWYGGRVPKSDLRTTAYGTIDEAGSAIGLARVLATAADPALAADLPPPLSPKCGDRHRRATLENPRQRTGVL